MCLPRSLSLPESHCNLQQSALGPAPNGKNNKQIRHVRIPIQALGLGREARERAPDGERDLIDPVLHPLILR